MGALTMTVSGGTGTNLMFRRTPKGVQLVESERPEFVPPVGLRARFELVGIAEPFQLPDNYSAEPGATKTMTRLEFTILKGGNNVGKVHEGKSFTVLYPYKMNPKSSLGELVAAIRGKAIEMGEAIDVDDYIGVSFVSITSGQQSNKEKFSRLSTEALELETVKWPSAAATAAAQDAAEDEDQDGNPFEDEAI